MSSRKSGLGKGLDALLPEYPLADRPAGESGVMQVAIGAISANPHQPRTHFEENALADLAALSRSTA